MALVALLAVAEARFIRTCAIFLISVESAVSASR